MSKKDPPQQIIVRRNNPQFRLAAAAGFATLAALWHFHPDWFAARLHTPYPQAIILQHYEHSLTLMPFLLLATALAFAIVAVAQYATARRPLTQTPIPALSPLAENVLLSGLLLLGLWLSWRHWQMWGRPVWDDYWKAGQVWHIALTSNDAQAWPLVQKFLHEYPHSPSPLTPWVIALLMFVVAQPVLWLQVLNAAATAGSVIVLQRLSKRLAPGVPFWFVGALFLLNAATMRNGWFIQLDAINGFFVLLFFHFWLRWRESPSPARLAALVVWLALCALQKTTLFPLMAVPTLVEAVGQVREKKLVVVRLLSAALWTAVVPAAVFVAYCLAFGIFANFGTQVQLMGSGWNELDFSFKRFVFAGGFLLGPYLPLMWRNRKILEPAYLGPALYVALFFLSMIVVRGPFWGRYYSHIVGCCVLLSLPALMLPARRLPLMAYLVAVALVQLTMIGLHLF